MLVLVLVLLVTGPEAPAQAQQSTPDYYTAWGDSIAKGDYWTLQQRKKQNKKHGRKKHRKATPIGHQAPYADYLYRDYVDKTGRTTHLINFAVNAADSGNLLARMSSASGQEQLASSQLITWNTGGADFYNVRRAYQNGSCGGSDGQQCLREAVSRFKSNWDGILSAVLQANSPSRAAIHTQTMYYAGVDYDKRKTTIQANGNDFDVLSKYLDEMNDYMVSTAEDKGIAVADIYHNIFNGSCGCEDPYARGVLLPDNLHPNQVGYQKIAQEHISLGWGTT